MLINIVLRQRIGITSAFESAESLSRSPNTLFPATGCRNDRWGVFFYRLILQTNLLYVVTQRRLKKHKHTVDGSQGLRSNLVYKFVVLGHAKPESFPMEANENNVAYQISSKESRVHKCIRRHIVTYIKYSVNRLMKLLHTVIFFSGI